MKLISLTFVAALLSCNAAFAYCDLTRFRGPCDLNTNLFPSTTKHALVYCGNSQVYLNQAQYNQLTRYQRRNVNMVLRINGEYIVSPCIPAGS